MRRRRWTFYGALCTMLAGLGSACVFWDMDAWSRHHDADGTPDAVGPSDADGASDGSDAQPFCSPDPDAGPHRICEGYDEPRTVAWMSGAFQGDVHLDQAAGHSRAGSLSATTFEAEAGEPGFANEYITHLATPSSWLRLEFSVRFDKIDATYEAAFPAISIKDEATGAEERVYLNTDALDLAFKERWRGSRTGSYVYNTFPLTSLTVGSFRHYAFEMHYTASGWALSGWVDGLKAFAEAPLEVGTVTLGSSAGSTTTLFVGLSYADPRSRGWSVHIDDVLFDMN